MVHSRRRIWALVGSTATLVTALTLTSAAGAEPGAQSAPFSATTLQSAPVAMAPAQSVPAAVATLVIGPAATQATQRATLEASAPIFQSEDGRLRAELAAGSQPLYLTYLAVEPARVPGPPRPRGWRTALALELQLQPQAVPVQVDLRLRYDRARVAQMGMQETTIRPFYFDANSEQWVELPMRLDAARSEVVIPAVDVSAFAAGLTRLDLMAP